MFLGFTIQQWLGFGVIGSIVSVMGTVFSTVLKEYFFARWFEVWKEQRDIQRFFENHKESLFQNTQELCVRIKEIIDQDFPDYLSSEILIRKNTKDESNTVENDDFKMYKLVSTIYRICSLFGWFEIFRQEMFRHKANLEDPLINIERIFCAIKTDFSDGQINNARDFENYYDPLVFREEIRAIGEIMIDFSGKEQKIIGYSNFFCLFEDNFENKEDFKGRWFKKVFTFLADINKKQLDYRPVRLKRIYVNLISLWSLLDRESIPINFWEAKEKFKAQIQSGIKRPKT